MFRDKVKYILSSKGISEKKYGEMIHMSKQSVNRKMTDAAFNVEDLITLGEFTDSRLVFLDSNNEVVVTFRREDIPQKKKKGSED